MAVDSASGREQLGAPAARHLSECSSCGQYASETFALMSLLAGQPAVEAPADFDFRLRAQLARARDRQQPMGGLRAFWSRSFSLQQAGLALTALALFAASLTFFSLREANGPQVAGTFNPDQPALAQESPAPAAAQTSELTSQVAAITTQAPPAPQIQPVNAAPQPKRMASGAGYVRAMAPVERAAEQTPRAAMAGAQEILVYRRGEMRSVILPRRGQVAWGAQLAGLQQAISTRPAAQQTVVETF